MTSAANIRRLPHLMADRREAGVTLVELIVVMVIIAIMLAATIPTLIGARKGAKFKEVLASAQVYDDAVRHFQQSRGGRAPFMAPHPSSARDWPSATKGPLDAQGRPILRQGPPEAMRTSRNGVVIQSAAASAADTARRSVLRYERVANGNASAYRITIHMQGEGGAAKCFLGDGITGGGPSVMANPVKRCQ